MTTTSNVIILGRRDTINDFDEMITVMDDNGKIFEIFCRGTKKPSSKNSISINELSVSSLEYFKSKSEEIPSKLMTGKLLHSYKSNVNSYEKLLKYLTIILKNNISSKFLYAYLNFIISNNRSLNSEREMLLISNLYITLNKFPSINKCVKCGTKNKIRTFSLEQYGLLCDEHINSYNKDMNKKQIYEFVFLFNHSIDRYNDYVIDQDFFTFLKDYFVSYMRNVEGIFI